MAGKAREGHTADFAAICQASELSREALAELLDMSIHTLDKWKMPSYRPGAPRWAVDLLPMRIAAHYAARKQPLPSAMEAWIKKS